MSNQQQQQRVNYQSSSVNNSPVSSPTNDGLESRIYAALISAGINKSGVSHFMVTQQNGDRVINEGRLKELAFIARESARILRND